MATAWPGNLAPISLGDRVCLSQGTYLCTGCLAEHPLWTAAHEEMVASACKCGQPGTAGPIL